MTIKEYTLSKKVMGINQWIEEINKDGLQEYESIIIKCADEFDMISINHLASFANTVI